MNEIKFLKKLVSFKKVIGSVYMPLKGNRLTIIYCRGAADFGDTGHTPEFIKLAEKGVTTIIPDYIGSNRSGGKIFSPQSTVNTIKEVVECLSKKETFDAYSREKIFIPSKILMLIGSSFGGSAALLYMGLVKNNPFKYLGLILPEADWTKDLDPQGFWNEMLVWKHVYRNIEKSPWKNTILGKELKWNPYCYIKEITNRKIYMAHGENYPYVSYKQSLKLAKELSKRNKVSVKVFKKLSHGQMIKQKGLAYIMTKVLKEV